MESNSKTLIFDIETVGMDFDTLDELSKEHIKKHSEKEEGLDEAKERLGLSPLTGRVITIGTLEYGTDTGVVLIENSDALVPQELESGVKLVSGSEAQILTHFWKLAQNYTTFVTFNGRAFDAPFLMIRSAILGIRPSKNLLANRYLFSQPFSAKHIDLFDQLSFYGASRTRSSLHFWTTAFGIPSPKDGGVTGNDVGRLFKEGKIFDIARYNLKDIKSTSMLYDKWNKYLNI